MYVQIHSFDEAKSDYGERPKGKKTSVSSAAFSVSIEDGCFVVRAAQTDQGSSVLTNKLATTPIRQITREVAVQFTPDDLRSLFQTALTEKLVTLAVTLPQRSS